MTAPDRDLAAPPRATGREDESALREAATQAVGALSLAMSHLTPNVRAAAQAAHDALLAALTPPSGRAAPTEEETKHV